MAVAQPYRRTPQKEFVATEILVFDFELFIDVLQIELACFNP